MHPAGGMQPWRLVRATDIALRVAAPIALRCLGPVAQFHAKPMRAEAGGARRRSLETPVFDNARGQAGSLFPGESTR